MGFTEHPSFHLPDASQSLWRFMDFPRLYYLLAQKQLYFASVDTLTNDPWEGFPPRSVFDPRRKVSVRTITPAADSPTGKQIDAISECEQHEYFGGVENYKKIASQLLHHTRTLRSQLFVSCWHASDYESEALWQIYGSSGKGVCIRTTTQHLSQSLRNSGEIYGGLVEYLSEAGELNGPEYIFKNCLWKRRSFEHEKEFRAVIWDQSPKTTGIPIPIDINMLVREIIVHPKAEEWFVQIVKHLASSTLKDPLVHRSTLMDTPRYEIENA